MFGIVTGWSSYFAGSRAPETNDESDDKELNSFTVIEETDFDGLVDIDCLLNQDRCGRPYLEKKGRLQHIVDDIFPVSGGCPSQATNIYGYFNALRVFNGTAIELKPSFIGNLLNSVALNQPSSVVVASKGGEERALLESILCDLHRIDKIIIEDRQIYDAKGDSDGDLGINHDDIADVKSKAIFEKCLELFDNDIQLTENILKLCTQASAAYMSTLLIFRFANYHEDVQRHLACITKEVEITSSSPMSMRCHYKTLWAVQSLTTQQYELFLNASMEFTLPKSELKEGRNDTAHCRLVISSFHYEV